MKSRVIGSLLVISMSSVQAMEAPFNEPVQSTTKASLPEPKRILRRPSGSIERPEMDRGNVPPLRARTGSGSSRSQGGTPRSSEDGSSPRSPRTGSLTCLDSTKSKTLCDLSLLKELATTLGCNHDGPVASLFEQAEERTTRLAQLVAQKEQEERTLSEIKSCIIALLNEQMSKRTT